MASSCAFSGPSTAINGNVQYGNYGYSYDQKPPQDQIDKYLSNDFD